MGNGDDLLFVDLSSLMQGMEEFRVEITRLRAALQRIADCKPEEDLGDPYVQIAAYAKQTARDALNGEYGEGTKK